MELSEAQDLLKEMKESAMYLRLYHDKRAQLKVEAIDTILKALDNSISKDEVRKVYADYFERVKHYEEHHLEKDEYYYRDKRICSILKELLGE